MGDGWVSYPMGIDFGFDPPAKELAVAQAETDDSLRRRLLYVAGDTGSVIQEISVAREKALDDIAERYGLQRRNS